MPADRLSFMIYLCQNSQSGTDGILLSDSLEERSAMCHSSILIITIMSSDTERSNMAKCLGAKMSSLSHRLTPGPNCWLAERTHVDL